MSRISPVLGNSEIQNKRQIPSQLGLRSPWTAGPSAIKTMELATCCRLQCSHVTCRSYFQFLGPLPLTCDHCVTLPLPYKYALWLRMSESSCLLQVKGPPSLPPLILHNQQLCDTAPRYTGCTHTHTRKFTTWIPQHDTLLDFTGLGKHSNKFLPHD